MENLTRCIDREVIQLQELIVGAAMVQTAALREKDMEKALAAHKDLDRLCEALRAIFSA